MKKEVTNKAAAPERMEKFATLSGIPLAARYTAEDLRGWDPEEKLGYPG